MHFPYGDDERVRVGVRMIMYGGKNGCPGTRDAQVGRPEQLLDVRRRGHALSPTGFS